MGFFNRLANIRSKQARLHPELVGLCPELAGLYPKLGVLCPELAMVDGTQPFVLPCHLPIFLPSSVET